MFGRIQNIDDTVIERIVKIHKPALTKIMIAASRAGNFGTIWWAICILFFLRPEWNLTGINIILGLCLAHLMGEIILKHIVKRERPMNS